MTDGSSSSPYSKPFPMPGIDGPSFHVALRQAMLRGGGRCVNPNELTEFASMCEHTNGVLRLVPHDTAMEDRPMTLLRALFKTVGNLPEGTKATKYFLHAGTECLVVEPLEGPTVSKFYTLRQLPGSTPENPIVGVGLALRRPEPDEEIPENLDDYFRITPATREEFMTRNALARQLDGFAGTELTPHGHFIEGTQMKLLFGYVTEEQGMQWLQEQNGIRVGHHTAIIYSEKTDKVCYLEDINALNLGLGDFGKIYASDVLIAEVTPEDVDAVPELALALHALEKQMAEQGQGKKLPERFQLALEDSRELAEAAGPYRPKSDHADIDWNRTHGGSPLHTPQEGSYWIYGYPLVEISPAELPPPVVDSILPPVNRAMSRPVLALDDRERRPASSSPVRAPEPKVERTDI